MSKVVEAHGDEVGPELAQAMIEDMHRRTGATLAKLANMLALGCDHTVALDRDTFMDVIDLLGEFHGYLQLLATFDVDGKVVPGGGS